MIEASREIVHEDNPTKKIERIDRICYKSEDMIKDGSEGTVNECLTYIHKDYLDNVETV